MQRSATKSKKNIEIMAFYADDIIFPPRPEKSACLRVADLARYANCGGVFVLVVQAALRPTA
jgi:hypothetical protein